MAIQLNDNLKINVGKPIDTKYLNGLVPYINVGEVLSGIPIGERYIGLTVNIGNVEWWFKDDLNTLEEKFLLFTGGTVVTDAANTGGGSGVFSNKTSALSGDTLNFRSLIGSGKTSVSFSGAGSEIIIHTPTGDTYVSGGTYTPSILTLLLTEGASDVTIPIGVSGVTDGVVSGGTISGSSLVLNRTIGLPNVVITGLTTGGTITASNGLTKTATDVILGGTLTGNTTIDAIIYDLDIDLGTITGVTSLVSADIGASTDEAILSFRNESGNNVASGFLEIALGTNNLNASTEAWGNIAIGQSNLVGLAATSDFAGGRNVAIGFSVGCDLTTGGNNVLLGRNVFQSSTTGAYNVMAGYGAGQNMTVNGKSNVAFGLFTMGNLTGGTGSYNTFLGESTGRYTASLGNQNVGIGGSSFRSGGVIAGFNSGVGNSTFRNATLGDSNTAVGVSAGRFASGSTNGTMVGRKAGWSLGGTDNSAFGSSAGCAPDATVSAGGTILTGSRNTFIGYQATWSIATPSINDSIVIGNDYEATETNKIYLASKGDIALIASHTGSSSGATTMTSSGLYYDKDYSATGSTNPRWIPDNAYVTGLTTGGTSTADNGLSINSSGDTVLGGTLTGNTTICQGVVGGAFGIAFGSAYGGTPICACGGYSFAIGLATLASGGGSFASGYLTTGSSFFSHAEGKCTLASGAYSHAEGYNTIASGYASHAGGDGDVPSSGKEVIAGGSGSFIHSSNEITQTAGHGALAVASAILGGRDHNIEIGNARAAIIGGDGIKLTGTTYVDTTAVDNFAIFTTPSAGASEDVLTWNPTTKKLNKVTQASIAGLAAVTASNGLTKTATDVILGGTLTGNTVVDTAGNGIAFGDGSGIAATGPNSFAGGYDACATGADCASFAFGYNVAATGGYGATVFGCGSIASGDASFAVNCGQSIGFESFAANNARACGGRSFAVNAGQACGVNSFAGGLTNIAIGLNSAILGGTFHNIASGNTNAAIIGGNNIALTGTTYIDFTAVDNLAIMTSPTTGSSNQILARNTNTGIIEVTTAGGGSGDVNNVYDKTGFTASTGLTGVTLTGSEYVVLVETSGATFTVTLPAAPVDGQAFKIKDKGNALANNITIAGGTIDGAGSATINTDYGALNLMYSLSDTEWYTLAFIS